MILKLNEKEFKLILDTLKYGVRTALTLKDLDKDKKDRAKLIGKLEVPKQPTHSRNREKGHEWERTVVSKLKELGFDRAMSSRAGDRFKDTQGIDIVNVPINIQCKRHHNFCSPVDALKKMPLRDRKVNVILMKIDNIKPDWKEEYAILTADHFWFMFRSTL